jgi:hypothetical protein
MKNLKSLCKSFEAASNNVVKFNNKLSVAKNELQREVNDMKVDTWSCKMVEIQSQIEEGIEEGYYSRSELLALSLTFKTVSEFTQD